MAVDPMPGWSPMAWLAGLSGLSGLGAAPARWDPSTAAGLPPVARRYLWRAIAPGTPLRRVVRLEMEGEFTLGGRRLPLRVERGNHFGTADYAPFFSARITAAAYD